MQNHTNWIISFEKRIIFCENSKWFYGYLMTTQILVQGKNVNKLPSSQLINICLLKVSNRNTRKMRKICSKWTVKTPDRHHRRHSDVFIVNFEHISHCFLVFLLLTLNKQMLAVFIAKLKKTYWVFITDFAHVCYSKVSGFIYFNLFFFS